nr:hypothetical protein Iba_scaffold1681380CG0010 [Ipomoea batatas]
MSFPLKLRFLFFSFSSTPNNFKLSPFSSTSLSWLTFEFKSADERSNPLWLDRVPWLMMRLISSGATFTYFSFSSVKSANCGFPDLGFFVFKDEVELELGSSLEFSGDEELHLPVTGADATVFLRRISVRSSF